MNRPQKLTLAIGLALGSSSAFGLGLGTIEVRSGLNEPLRAEIPVRLTNAKEADGLRASLATSEDFKRVGIDPVSLPRNLSIAVGKNARGETVIQVTSPEPLTDPMLSLLLDVNWSSGRMLREYTVLLDPPGVGAAIIGSSAVPTPVREDTPTESVALETQAIDTPQTAQQAEADPPPMIAQDPKSNDPLSEPVVVAEAEPSNPEMSEAPTEPQASVETEPTQEPMAEPKPEPSPEPVATNDNATNSAAPVMASSEYGPVAAGETLWEIADNTRPGDDVAVNQMMLALLRANPNAFYEDNINTLKRGAILRVPSSIEAQSLTAAQALAEVRAQTRTWRASRMPVTLASDSAPSTRPSSSELAANSTSKSGSRLEIVPASSSSGNASSDRPGVKGGTGDTAASKAELQRTKEALSSANLEVSELSAQVKELERIKNDDAKLITLKNDELAQLRARLAEAEKQSANQAATQAASQAAIAKAEAQAAAEKAALAPQTAAPTVDSTTATTTFDSATVDASAVDSSVAATDLSATPTDPSGTSSAQTDSSVAATSEVEVKPIEDQAPAEAIVTTEETPAPTPWWKNMKLLGAAGAGVLGLAALAALLMRRKPKVEREISNGVSRQAEAFAGAPVGMASMSQSEDDELLNRLASDPTDLDAHLDLLSVYYRRHDAGQFEAAAEAMYAQVGNPNDMRWQQALSMGRALVPDHPMFGDDETAAASSAAFSGDDFGFELPSHIQTTPPAPRAAASASEFDFDKLFDQPSVSAPAIAPAANPDRTLEVSQNDIKTAQMNKPGSRDSYVTAPGRAALKSADAVAPEAKKMESDLGALDFNWDKAETVKTPVVPEKIAEIPSYNAMDDAVSTKLDLARAYMDMGDPEGARSMLEEVLAEGNQNQREDASRLLSEIK